VADQNRSLNTAGKWSASFSLSNYSLNNAAMLAIVEIAAIMIAAMAIQFDRCAVVFA
jgi:hypothetical protein